MRCTAVTYTIKPECKDEHLGLIGAIFVELNSSKLNNIDYRVIQSEDGLTFSHSSTKTNDDGSNPITEQPAFKLFTKDLSQRVVSPPVGLGGVLLGDYHSDK